MESIGALLGVLLVFFVGLVAFIVLGRRGAFSSSDGDSFERVMEGVYEECKECDEVAPLNDVSEIKVALHSEKSYFGDKVIENIDNSPISECLDSQNDIDNEEMNSFSLKDGILYSIILEKRQF